MSTRVTAVLDRREGSCSCAAAAGFSARASEPDFFPVLHGNSQITKGKLCLAI